MCMDVIIHGMTESETYKDLRACNEASLICPAIPLGSTPETSAKQTLHKEGCKTN